VPSEAVQLKAVNPVSLFLGLHKSKTIVVKLSFLFMLDSFGGSFVLQSIISGWFHTTYNTSYETLGAMVFICNIVAGVSALFAAKLADNIGLVLTMVVTCVSLLCIRINTYCVNFLEKYVVLIRPFA
jgi:MFS family permease